MSKSKSDLPSIALIMNTYASLGAIEEQMGAGGDKEIELFLSKVPVNFKKKIKKAILSDSREEALSLSCGYVVKFFDYVPITACKYHGTFVYELLKSAMQQ
jgi:hypothetical protein